MESLKEISSNQQSRRPAYFDDPEKDLMIVMLLELTEDICVLEDQLDICMQITSRGELATEQAIESYRPTDQHLEQRLAKHTKRFEAVFEKLIPVDSKQNTEMFT